jgi:hypothetical protein
MKRGLKIKQHYIWSFWLKSAPHQLWFVLFPLSATTYGRLWASLIVLYRRNLIHIPAGTRSWWMRFLELRSKVRGSLNYYMCLDGLAVARRMCVNNWEEWERNVPCLFYSTIEPFCWICKARQWNYYFTSAISFIVFRIVHSSC